jgi:hypothetical protein
MLGLFIVVAVAVVDQSPPPPPTPPVEDATFRATVIGGGCLGQSSSTFNEIEGLAEGLRVRRVAFRLGGASQSAVGSEGSYLFPPADAGEWMSAGHVEAFLRSTEPTSTAVVDDDVPVLVTSTGVYFQRPARGRTDWLTMMKATRDRDEPGDVRAIVNGRLSRVTRGTKTVWLLQVPTLAGDSPADAVLTKPMFDLETHYVIRVPLPDDVELYGFNRSFGSPERVKAVATATREGAPLFHLGPYDSGPASATTNAWCAKAVRELEVAAAVPTPNDLARGLAPLTAFARDAKLPLVMSDLRPQEGTAEAAAISPWTLVEDRGRVALVLGVVGEAGIAALPEAERKNVRSIALSQALDDAIVAASGRLGRAPDVVIVLSGLTGSGRRDAGSLDRRLLLGVSGVHVVLERRARSGSDVLVQMVEDVGRGTPRSPPAVFGHANTAVGSLEVRMKDGRPAMYRFRDALVTSEAPVDLDVRRTIARSERPRLLEGTRVAIPEPDAFVRAHAELHPFVWGDHVFYSGRRQSLREHDEPPMLYDHLWLTLLANVARASSGADAAFVLNHERSSDMIGPIIRDFVSEWLARSGDVLELTLSGTELQGLLSRLPPLDTSEPQRLVMTSGVNVVAGRIGGRPITPAARYRVVVSAALVDEPGLGDILRPHVAQAPTRALKDIVLARLDAAGGGTGTFTPAATEELLSLLLPQRDVVPVTVQAGVDELSGQTIALRNSDDIGTFAVTRETRATSPNLFQGGLRLNAFALVDGPDVAFETRLKVAYDGVLIDLPAVPVNQRLSEQRDDVVFSTELRANRIGIAIADDRVQVVPFVQAAFDSELTATPDASKPDAWLPHQLIVREALGVVASPGPLLRQIRLGAVLQHDLSDLPGGGDPHHDVGVTAGYQATLPLVGPLLLQSELDVRYFVPDSDDRAVDLSLRLQAVERLVLPLSEAVSMFVFVDGFVIAGKTALNDTPGWNAITGIGLQFSGLWR